MLRYPNINNNVVWPSDLGPGLYENTPVFKSELHRVLNDRLNKEREAARRADMMKYLADYQQAVITTKNKIEEGVVMNTQYRRSLANHESAVRTALKIGMNVKDARILYKSDEKGIKALNLFYHKYGTPYVQPGKPFDVPSMARYTTGEYYNEGNKARMLANKMDYDGN